MLSKNDSMCSFILIISIHLGFAGEIKVGDHVKIKIAKYFELNVHEAKHSGSKVIRKIINNDMVKILSKEDIWFEIEYNDGIKGWINYAQNSVKRSVFFIRSKKNENRSAKIDYPVQTDNLNQKNTSTQLLQSPEVIGKIRITNNVDIYQNCISNGSFGDLSGPIIGKIIANEEVDLLDLMSTGGLRPPYFQKIRTQKRIIGWVHAYFKKIEFYGDKGAITLVDISQPYEFECSLGAVDKMIKKYEGFVLNYPNSNYKLYALSKMAWLYRYTLQCPISAEEKYKSIVRIKDIYKKFLEEIFKADNHYIAKKIFDETMTQYSNNVLNLQNYNAYEGFDLYKRIFLDNLIDELCLSPYGNPVR